MFSPFPGNGPCQLHYAALGCAVGSAVGKGPEGLQGSDVDDAAPVVLRHGWHKALCQEEGGSQMHVELCFPSPGGNRAKGFAQVHACGVHKDIDSPMALKRFLRARECLLGRPEIAGKDVRLHALFFHAPPCLAKGILSACHKDDPGPGISKGPGNGVAYAGASACHKGCLPLQGKELLCQLHHNLLLCTRPGEASVSLPRAYSKCPDSIALA